MRRWQAAATALAITIPLTVSGCGGGDSGSEASGDKTLTLWHFEDPSAATAIAWNEAIKVFESETGAKVKFEAKSFEQTRSTASQVLNSKEAPDILEYPKGNATAGLLSSQGLLTDLTPQVEKRGWNKSITGSLATTSQYDDKGIMGSGPWYGVTNYGEFVQVYYNKDMFAK
ncbi:MAG TPA: extracellular solute-binding protein, partial [Actinoplanes sp.]